jgi:cytosine/adenosine deaminase-related metal-dependent hydrolase
VAFTLRNARIERDGGEALVDLAISGERVSAVERPGALPTADVDVDLEGRWLTPALVNAHDHLDFSTFPALGSPPYRSVYEWAESVDGGRGDAEARDALGVPLADRLFLGGLRNLLSGVSAVAHHNSYHRSLGRRGFPVRVLARYHFAHSPGLTPHLRRTYRTTDRRIPWMVHLAEGTDERCRREFDLLVRDNLVRQNTVMIHAIALAPEQMATAAAAQACVVWCPESNRRLYGGTACVRALRAAGVRLGLGSDSPVSGARDALSNLAAARAEGVDDGALLRLATRESAEVARLPVGRLEPGAPADLLVATSTERLLAGDRAAVSLVMVDGRPLYGESALMSRLDPRSLDIAVEGASRRLEAVLARRTGTLLRRYPTARRAAWAAGVEVG